MSLLYKPIGQTQHEVEALKRGLTNLGQMIYPSTQYDLHLNDIQYRNIGKFEFHEGIWSILHRGPIYKTDEPKLFRGMPWMTMDSFDFFDSAHVVIGDPVRKESDLCYRPDDRTMEFLKEIGGDFRQRLNTPAIITYENANGQTMWYML